MEEILQQFLDSVPSFGLDSWSQDWHCFNFKGTKSSWLMQDVFIFFHPQCDSPSWGFSDSESGESRESHEVKRVSFDSSESMGQPAEVWANWPVCCRCVHSPDNSSGVSSGSSESDSASFRGKLSWHGLHDAACEQRHPMQCREQMCCRNKTPQNELCVYCSQWATKKKIKESRGCK